MLFFVEEYSVCRIFKSGLLLDFFCKKLLFYIMRMIYKVYIVYFEKYFVEYMYFQIYRGFRVVYFSFDVFSSEGFFIGFSMIFIIFFCVILIIMGGSGLMYVYTVIIFVCVYLYQIGTIVFLFNGFISFCLTATNSIFFKKYFAWLRIWELVCLSSFFFLVCLKRILCNFFAGYNVYLHSLLLNISPFSDIILLLSIITIFLSSAYLSERDTRFNWGGLSFFNIFIAITIQLVSVEDLLSMFIYFELLFFPSLFFIFKYGYVQKAEGGMLFLFGWTLCGATICLVGFVYLYFIVHSLQFSVIRSFQFSDSERLFFGFIFCVGFGVKMPLWPCYYWLVKVHVDAPAGFSMFLSGFLIKTAFYCVCMVYFLFSNFILDCGLICLVMVGCIDASLRIWAASDIKKFVAYCTVQEMHFLFLFVLLSDDVTYYTVNVFLFSHGCLSIFLFFEVELLQKITFTRDLTGLSGLSVYYKFLAVSFWLALLCFRSFPIFAKFLVEASMLFIIMLNFHVFGFILFFFFTLTSIMGFTRIVFCILYGQPQNYYFAHIVLSWLDHLLGLFLIGLILLITLFFIYF